MGELAARTIFSNDTGPLAGTGLDTLAKNQGAILELEGAQAPQSKTITDGSISPTAAYVIVDTEGSAAADDLDVINPVLSASENLHDGMVVYLKAADSGRVVTVKNSSSANGINTYDGNDYVLSTTHWFKLQLRSGKWYEVEGREMVVALAAATAAAAASTPATTTARGIGRVAAQADFGSGTPENGPACLVADGDYHLPVQWIPGLFAGDMRLLPFRAADLATHCPGWHFCNGDQYSLTSDVGIALNGLPESFKTDWGIDVTGDHISIPKIFYSDGRGYFLRAVDGTTRQVGSVQQDAFKSHTHTSYPARKGGPTYVQSGPTTTNLGGEAAQTGATGGTETCSLNVGMTPAIFLDV